MTLGILVRSKPAVLAYSEKGQINQAVEMAKNAKIFGIKIKIIDFEDFRNFGKIKKTTDIIHDKCYSQRKEEKIIFKNFHKKCKKEGLPIFNDYGLIRVVGNKWKLNEFLKDKESIKECVVPTFFYDKKKIRKLLKTYGTLILKPIWGQEGTGVIEIKKNNGFFLASYKKREGGEFKIKTEKLKNLQDIESVILELWRNNNYIIQPKINSAKFENNVFDIRLTLQKMKDWEIGGIGARVAGKGSFLCNIAAGGEMFNGEYAIGKVFPQKKDNIIKKIESTAIEIGEFLEKEVDGIVAEIGFDFMIDEKGRAWLLEINSKPSPEIFYKKELEKMRRKMTFWPILFAKYYYGNKK
ncbi:MAG: YheC/YheD family protein [Candidatus Pacebacteria bacterium]|nr:YheC/YheD family protein [Candidatus Paceibacterota bacterium]